MAGGKARVEARPGSASDAGARAAKMVRAGNLTGALSAYEAALALRPNDPDILAALAALAARMEMMEVAASLWEKVALLQPGRLEAIDGRARALRELGQFDAAVEVLRQVLVAHPEDGRLWNSLGVTLTQSGQTQSALIFLDKAIELDPRSAAALYNRGNAHFDLGQLEAAQSDFTQAAKVAKEPADATAIAFAKATLALARGDLAEGWDGYETRLSRRSAKAVVFETPGRRWAPRDPLAGKHLLVIAEQGLGDELMFANVLPDVIEALGPRGQLSLAVEPRLVALFQRSFPGAYVSAHATDRAGRRPRRTAPGLASQPMIDLWAPMGSLPQRFRPTTNDFPPAWGYLRPDPQRVAHWSAWLGSGPPAIGVTWRSGKMAGDRRRQYPPPPLWAPILSTPGVRFVNLQYGDCDEELAEFRAAAGRAILEPPGLDLHNDIDDLAALCVALDLVLGVSNATAALAGACGAPAALIGGPANWTRLGAPGYPWYPSARALVAPAFGEWAATMDEAATLVSGLAASAS